MKINYKAKDRNGILQQGELEADSIAVARSKLKSDGLFVLSLDTVGVQTAANSSASQFGFSARIKTADLLTFMSQLTIMCQSGVDLAESLRNLAEQCPRPALKEVFTAVYRDVSAGVSFSAALKRHPRAFDQTFIAGIAAGECTGTITQVLDRLTNLIRTEMLMYPIVLCGVTFVVLNALIFFVLPQFSKVFLDLGRTPPPLTQLLLATGDFARGYGLWFLLAIPLLAIAWYFLRTTEPVQLLKDRFLLNGWAVRHATRALSAGRIFRLLGTMLQSGVPLVECIRLCRSAARNLLYRRLFAQIESDVLQGQGMSKSLVESPFLPQGAAQMVATAERSGRLGQVLQTIGEFYEDEGERHIRDLIKILEPAIILSLGVVVAVVVLSVVLPLLDVSTVSH
jgi:type II secretory pathway component PulF